MPPDGSRAFELVAHRGCGGHCPENTVQAVRASAGRLPAVEVDVRRCGSGELVAVHDERVDRVTDGAGRVADLTLAELRDLRVDGADESIPTLSAVVDAVPADVTLQVELKERGLARDVLDAVAPLDRVRLSSFDPGALEPLAPDPPVPTGYLFRDDPDENLDVAADLGCANVHPHWRTCAETDVVVAARERGFGVLAWGAGSDPEAVAATRAAGADGVTVDRWDLD